ncbi:MAG: hypothetical protein ACI9VT_003684, partial [Psychroserpens sp.]
TLFCMRDSVSEQCFLVLPFRPITSDIMKVIDEKYAAIFDNASLGLR